jgi:hypothetical protein
VKVKAVIGEFDGQPGTERNQREECAMRILQLTMFLVVSIVGIVACAGLQPGTIPKDGDLALPEGYRSWPTFLKDVQKPDAVRDLYVNPVGARASKGDAFPNGTQFVMEIYGAKKEADGTLAKGADGKLVKDKLAKIFVMGKDKN